MKAVLWNGAASRKAGLARCKVGFPGTDHVDRAPGPRENAIRPQPGEASGPGAWGAQGTQKPPPISNVDSSQIGGLSVLETSTRPRAAIMAAAVPPPLKAADVSRFAHRAGQLETQKPVVAYYCEYPCISLEL